MIDKLNLKEKEKEAIIEAHISSEKDNVRPLEFYRGEAELKAEEYYNLKYNNNGK